MHDLTAKYVGKVKGVNPNLSFIEHEINNYRILALPGGTRSGKTQSVLRWIWKNLHTFSGVEYTIVRKTLTALKQTALKDFVEIGVEFGLYSERYHNRTEQLYNYNGNRVLFLGADDGEKLRGCAQDVLYINEAPELEWEPVKQLLMRTRHKTIMDYNPSYPESWIYDKVHTRETTASLTTTFEDNPHISGGELEEILWMRDNDPESYKIYGLGQRGELRGQVYKNWTKIKEMPVDYAPSFVIDFGFANDPCVLAKFSSHNRAIYGKQCVYQVGMNNDILGIHMYYAGVRAQTHVLADSAEPKSIAELNRGWDVTEDWLKEQCRGLEYEYTPDLLKVMKEGYTVFAVKKGQDTIDAGIQKVKQYEVLIEDSSHDAWKEYRQYRWMEDSKTGKLLNKPIDQHNHFNDCLRYYAMYLMSLEG